MLKRIYADNFRSLVNFECVLAERQLILGANGSGKSSIFDILSFLRDLCGRGESAAGNSLVAMRPGASTKTRWQNVDEQTFELDVTGIDGEYRFRLVIEPGVDPFSTRILKEEIFFSGSTLFERTRDEIRHLDDTGGMNRIALSLPGSVSALGMLEFRENSRIWWFKHWLRNLLVIAPNPWQMSSLTPGEVPYPESDLSNFASWYRHLKLDVDDQEYLKDLADIMEGFVRFRFEEVGRRSREIKACFKQSDRSANGGLVEYSLDELSDGQRVLIGIYAVLHFALRPGATVCFDEPDNFIALREVQPWLDKIFDRTEDEAGSQVIIASHHPELLNTMAYKEGILFDRPDGRQTRIKRFEDPCSTGLSAAELVARGWEL